ncbi:cell envelope integrity EipB family protein [Roseibium sp.]|uniref:cell envelope integrity EipB family protein n=1 Tax=Roseibium sp. TaxID=1936156 RepID=UPI003A972455
MLGLRTLARGAVVAQVAALLAASGPAHAGPGVGLVPHRAVYDMELMEADERSGVAALSGRMVYDFSGSSCEGYSISFRFVTEFVGAEGGSQITDLRTSSYEGGQGNSFQFLSKTFVDQKQVEATRGTAKDDGKTKTVSLQDPENREFEIDQSTLFPTVHLRKIIEAARQGEAFLAAEVFDGSETGDKVYSTTTVIGAAHDGVGATDPDWQETDLSELPAVTHWPVTIAYFDPENADGGEETPAYQLSFLLYENGISRQLALDYGDFSIRGSLSDLELYEETACTN